MADTPQISQEEVLRALGGVVEPGVPGDLVSRRALREVRLGEGKVALEVMLALPGNRHEMIDRCRQALLGVPGVREVEVKVAMQPGRPGPAAAPLPQQSEVLPGVRHLVAIGSGKGGVGKSTVAVNLAVALARQGMRVGLLDADVYGPSIPTMMGIRHPPFTQEGRMMPLEKHGVKLMSLGFLMTDDTAHVIWRGPMVGGAVRQMLMDCEWGQLDFLLTDLPPGTGDAQLTLAQTVPLTGAVVVMTSQDVAVNIASKAVGMFQKLNVPILGVVGNMDAFACPNCGTQTPIFTRGGSEAAAERMGVPFLGSIPLDPAAVEHGDRGTPTVLAAPDSESGRAFQEVARRLLEQVAGAEEEAEGADPLGGLGRHFPQQ
jgi:ATP-binding protein involved in chromosome partitioning